MVWTSRCFPIREETINEPDWSWALQECVTNPPIMNIQQEGMSNRDTYQVAQITGIKSEIDLYFSVQVFEFGEQGWARSVMMSEQRSVQRIQEVMELS